MKMMKTITYFDSPGPENTEDCAVLAVERATELGITTIVAASSGGATARAFARAVAGTKIHLAIVTHAVGFSSPGVWEFDAALADELRAAWHTIVCGTHALSGLERALSRSPRIGGGSRTEAIAEAFRRTI
ncbi:MAG TPA: hypothetical protein O0X23_03085, partial [Methanocorpusculum sp.]|nr:hypothetical protein [Methanocorpusculum sp.]